GSTRATQHDGLPDSDHRLADVLVPVPDGAERPDAVRGQQRGPDGWSCENSTAVDSEHQHNVHRARRTGARGALYPNAGAWMENRHTEAVRGVAAVDGARLSHSAAWDQTGGRRWQERVRVAVPELRAAKHR